MTKSIHYPVNPAMEVICMWDYRSYSGTIIAEDIDKNPSYTGNYSHINHSKECNCQKYKSLILYHIQPSKAYRTV